MFHRRRTAAAAALLAAGLLTAACGGGSSYSDKAEACARAIAARPAGDSAKPKACEAITDDDYATLNEAHELRSAGVVDDNGNVDLDKLLSTP
jgi:hypothetical protein